MNDRTLACLLGGALVVSLARQETQAEIVTKRLVIVDEQQRPRIVAHSSPHPRIVLRSETGEDLIQLGIGDETDAFPFGQDGVSHLTFGTGGTRLRLWVSPPPGEEDSEYQFEGAHLEMSSAGADRGNFLNAIIRPDKANIAIATLDPEDPAASIFDPGVHLSIDRQGDVTTRLGREDK